jgi:hypothetical protein
VFRNSDTSGLTVDTSVSFTLSQASYSGSVVTTAYSSGTGFGSSLTTSLIGNSQLLLPTWTGQLQNWQNNLIYLWVRLKTYGVTDQALNVDVTNVNSGVNRQGDFPSAGTTVTESSITASIGTQTGSGSTETFTYTNQSLSAFSANSTQIANEICPGMINATTTPSYDFERCALVNLKLEITQAPYSSPTGGQTWEAELMYSLASGAGSTKYSLPYVSGTIVPFYSNTSGGTQGSQIAPTATPIPTGPN